MLSNLPVFSKTGPATHFCLSAPVNHFTKLDDIKVWQTVPQVPVHALAESPSIIITISDLISPESYRFFETEGIAILTTLVSQYKVSVKEEPQFAHETFEERKVRIIAARQGLTTTYVVMFFFCLPMILKPNSIAPFVFLWSSPAGTNRFLE